MKVQSKKDYYTVECANQTQTADVLNFIQGNDERDYFHWRYVSKCEEGFDDVNNSIPERLSYLPVISFEEWQSLPDFPKPQYDPKDLAFNQRKVVGYKLIKPEYREAVKAIINRKDWFHNFDINLVEKGFNFGYTDEKDPRFCDSINYAIKKSGVLDIWFEPVYEKETITLKSGVKLSEDDIAEVKEILNNK